MRFLGLSFLAPCALMLTSLALFVARANRIYNGSRPEHVMVAYEQYYHVESTARQRPVVIIFPSLAEGMLETKAQSSNLVTASNQLDMIWKRAMRHPALYSDLFSHSFFCIRNLPDVDSVEAHFNSSERKSLRFYSHKCINREKLNGNEIFFQKQQIKNGTKKAKKKIRKSENAIQDGGWIYYASLRKVRKRMNGIGIRRNDIDRLVFDHSIMDIPYKYRTMEKPFIIQNAMNQSKSFRNQFYRNNFVKLYGGVTLYRNKGKHIRISDIVEKMRLKHYENSGLCNDLKPLHQHRLANLVVETALVESDYSFLKIPKHNRIRDARVSIACSLAYVGFREQLQGKWNAILFGRRKWILLSPRTNHTTFACKKNHEKYMFLIESKDHKHVCTNASKTNYSGTLEGLQMQGELLFIPKGWYYAYIDIGETFAITFGASSLQNNE